MASSLEMHEPRSTAPQGTGREATATKGNIFLMTLRAMGTPNAVLYNASLADKLHAQFPRLFVGPKEESGEELEEKRSQAGSGEDSE